jgi:hypothetical protein
MCVATGATIPEELYTSRLDASRFSAEQLATAARLASEIDARAVGGAAHADDAGEDEGAAFSDVPRAAAPRPDAFTDGAVAARKP